MTSFFYQFIGALGLALVLTPLVRYFAQRYGKVAVVRDDRWHKKPIPAMGGIAIWLSWILVVLFSVKPDIAILVPIIGATAIFLLGFADDLFHLQPQTKLIGQIVVAAAMIKFGIVIQVISNPLFTIPLTIFWIVGITNAINLLDNMDGLSAGIAAIGALALFIHSIQIGDHFVALQSAAITGAALGFLRYNFYPAKIFMGDSGSLFLGFLLAVLSIKGTWQHASSLVVTMAIPLLILAIPIFDTVFVTITRRIQGKPISQGGRDHISHRLVALGISERQAVIWLYMLSLFLGAISLFYNKINSSIIIIGMILLMVLLYFLGVFLGEMEVYAKNMQAEDGGDYEKEGGQEKDKNPVSRRRIFEMLIDIILFSIAYFSAYLVRFESTIPDNFINTYVNSLPWVIVIKCAIFYYMGLYRNIWRYVSIRDMVDIIKAATLCSLVIVLIASMHTRLESYSRSVFFIDWMITIMLIGGSRFFFRVLKEYLGDYQRKTKNVLIIGAGDAGEMVLREIRNNSDMNYNVIGFVDDDPKKQKNQIHNVPILGKIEDIAMISKTKKIDEALLAILSIQKKSIEKIDTLCTQCGVTFKRIPMIREMLKNKYPEEMYVDNNNKEKVVHINTKKQL